MPTKVSGRLTFRLYLYLFRLKLVSNFCELSQNWLVVERRVEYQICVDGSIAYRGKIQALCSKNVVAAVCICGMQWRFMNLSAL
jgi:hypothetical protein